MILEMIGLVGRILQVQLRIEIPQYIYHMLQEKIIRIETPTLFKSRMAQSHIFYDQPPHKNIHPQAKKSTNKTILSMIRPNHNENSKSRLTDALTTCPIKTKEQEEQQYRELLEMKDQVFKAKYLIDPFFKTRVMSKVRRYEKLRQSVRKLAESYPGLETENCQNTLVHLQLVEKSNLENLYNKYLRILDPPK